MTTLLKPTLLNQYTEMLVFIEKVINNAEFSNDVGRRNVTVAATLLSLTIDHAQGVRFLLQHSAYPSATVLQRSAFEAYIRGMWFWKCASDKQIEEFIRKDKILSDEPKKEIKFGEMVTQVENCHDFPQFFTCVKGKLWRAMNSFTHGGTVMLSKLFSKETINYTYTADDLDEVIVFMSLLSLFAFTALADISKTIDYNKVEELFEIMEPWAFAKVYSWIPTRDILKPNVA